MELNETLKNSNYKINATISYKFCNILNKYKKIIFFLRKILKLKGTKWNLEKHLI